MKDIIFDSAKLGGLFIGNARPASVKEIGYQIPLFTSEGIFPSGDDYLLTMFRFENAANFTTSIGTEVTRQDKGADETIGLTKTAKDVNIFIVIDQFCNAVIDRLFDAPRRGGPILTLSFD